MSEERKTSDSRILFAAPKSGSGKTTVVCGVLELLKRKGLCPTALKCGPDYIDPMFHRAVLQIPTGNIDTFFTDPDMTRALLFAESEHTDITVMEAAMGYFDGLGGMRTRGSAWETACVTGTPAVLVLDAQGGSVSLAAVVKGFLEFQPEELRGIDADSAETAEKSVFGQKREACSAVNNGIRGIFLNRVSRGYYPRLKRVIENSCGIPVIGYLPNENAFRVPSRHLGLIDPAEMPSFRDWIRNIADVLEETLDLDALLAVAGTAEVLRDELSNENSGIASFVPESGQLTAGKLVPESRIRIAVAKDEAFSFFYTENELLLKSLGAEPVFFSPMRDEKLPDRVSGLILGGGYPERFARELSRNQSLREQIRQKIEEGLPTLAECGGFLYLQKNLEGADGERYAMCGVLEGEGYRTKSLRRFGYLTAVTKTDGIFGPAGTALKGHEFHHWDCTENGDGLSLSKPMADASENACVYRDNLCAGFPHFYYPSNPEGIRSFLKTCIRYEEQR